VTGLLASSLTEICEVLRSGGASPVDLMNESLSAVDRRQPELNAIVAMRPRDALLAEAAAAEQRIREGKGRPLEGIPLGVKDLEDVAGMVTSHGSRPYAGNVAAEDSTQVRRLRAAGAIVVCKTNAPEFGTSAYTRNLLHGVTGSPWDPSRTPGGSSGGSAAALAGEMLPLVTASDGGGSIRIPASFVGAFGLKTSYGRIPRGPFELWEYGMTAVYGPLTKTVDDAALFLDQVVGSDPFDPASLPHPGLSYAELLRGPLPSGLRIGFSPDLGYAVVDSEIAKIVEEAAQTFAKLGHRLSPVRGGPPDLAGEWGLFSMYEIGGRIAPLLPRHEAEFSNGLMRTIAIARGMDPAWLGETARKRAALVRWVAEIFSEYDLLLTPTVPYDPPPAKGPLPSETEGRRQTPSGVAAFTIPFNMSWNPAASVRAGISRAGLPVGLQIVGPQHRDDLVLLAARAYERERPWHPRWPRS
jgi:aspartyl-tRNA(Asn)/glutamyl-tRNA(Gln) amidotransferase subunit A